jgi:VCBS repeat-containing protein
VPQDVVVHFKANDGTADSNVQTLTITVTGTNDAPVASAAVNSANEGAAVINGNVSATDADDGAVLTYSLTEAAPAGLTFNSDGSYSFDPANGAYNHLAAGVPQDVVVHFKANDGTADSNVQTLTITVTGTNDAATIGGTVSGSVTEDAIPNTVSGTATAIDVDNPNNTFLVESGDAGHGTFSVAANGTWTYALNNADSVVDALNNGNTLPDSFTIHSADGTAQTVSITINGHTDAPPDTQGPTGVNFVFNAATIGQLETGTQLDANTILGTFVQTGDPNSTVFHYALGGTNSGLFSLNTSTGVLSTGAGNIPANGTTPYDLTITAFDQANNASPALAVKVFVGGTGKQNLIGTSGIDLIFGQNGDDTLSGSSGSDALVGGQNDDQITGGLGADQLVGGGGNDNFFYGSVNDSNAANGIDTIYAFKAAGTDKIDLSAIDSTPPGGDDVFAWGAAGAATAHGVWVTQSGADAIVHADTDGNTATDELTIILAGVTASTVGSGDFNL